jgi:hypothetical protein
MGRPSKQFHTGQRRVSTFKGVMNTSLLVSIQHVTPALCRVGEERSDLDEPQRK